MSPAAVVIGRVDYRDSFGRRLIVAGVVFRLGTDVSVVGRADEPVVRVRYADATRMACRRQCRASRRATV
jgi:hypothetical protein